jgi:hypothetical protein
MYSLWVYLLKTPSEMNSNPSRFSNSLLFLFALLIVVISCGPNASPEGRMTQKVESMHRELLDSLKAQHRDLLDSLASMRKELEELRKKQK